MSRQYNFCAGPAALPTEVLQQARHEMLDWQGRGLSVMEMSHRSDDFQSIAYTALGDLRELLAVPANYQILFMQGGATAQFSAVPLNLLGDCRQVDYLDTGVWSGKAIREARRYADVNVVADGSAFSYNCIDEESQWRLNAKSAYFHYTPNETIGGFELPFIPSRQEVPLVADMSSTILSQPLDVSTYGLIYAGAQKNIGPAGLTLVIVRDDLLDSALVSVPGTMSYKLAVEHKSMFNTPPTYSWYLAGLIFKWLKAQGGLQIMAERNKSKARKLYDVIDGSGLYSNSVEQHYRSRMNVPFTLANSDYNALFLAQANQRGLLNLSGHQSQGGMRASIYNAIPESAVVALTEFMTDFEKQHG